MTNQEINEAVARKLGLVPTNGKAFQYDTRIPNYTTSIAEAWEILTEHCDEWHLDCRGTVTARLKKNYVEAEVTADTAPLAICLAFLRLK